MKNYTVSPTLGKNPFYVTWKKEIKLCEAFTLIQKQKRSLAIFMPLAGEARKSLWNIETEILVARNRIENLIEGLDKMYIKDGKAQTCKVYETSRRFMRPSDMSI